MNLHAFLQAAGRDAESLTPLCSLQRAESQPPLAENREDDQSAGLKRKLAGPDRDVAGRLVSCPFPWGVFQRGILCAHIARVPRA
jgi:hypothetical protein